MPTFQEFLKEKLQHSRESNRLAQQAEWLGAIERLFAQVTGWLKELDPEGLMTLTGHEKELNEPALGVYRAPWLQISVAGDWIQVVPVGRYALGYVNISGNEPLKARGRVDITNGLNRYVWYRTTQGEKEIWYIVDEQTGAQLLNRDVLEKVLRELLS